jgi:hypothetical protein
MFASTSCQRAHISANYLQFKMDLCGDEFIRVALLTFLNLNDSPSNTLAYTDTSACSIPFSRDFENSDPYACIDPQLWPEGGERSSSTDS